jgi:hypothetical protein
MELIVSGSRYGVSKEWLEQVLSAVHEGKPIDVLITGGCSGVDIQAEQWALSKHVPVLTYKADWTSYGRAAGPIRNRQMLKLHPEATVLLFPGGDGTSNMRRSAVERGRTILVAEDLYPLLK